MENESKNINQINQDYQIDFDYIDGISRENKNSVENKKKPVKNNEIPLNNNAIPLNNNVIPVNYEDLKPVEPAKKQFEVKPVEPSKQFVEKKKKDNKTATIIRIVALVLICGWLAFLFFDLISAWY